MIKDTEQACKEILADIMNAKKFSQLHTYHDLFMGAEGIIANMAWLVAPLLEAEQAYRIKIQSYRKDGESVAGATAKAQCDPEYLEYKKIQYVYDLADEQCKLIKKFSDKLESEWNRTK